MKIDVLGVKINSESKAEILEQLGALLDPSTSLRTGKPVFIVTPYSESIVSAQKDVEFRNILNQADFALPDGAGIVWAAKLLTSPQPSPISERVPGREFIWDLVRLAESRGLSIFLLGGFGDTPEIVAAKLKERFPKLRVAGTSNGTPHLTSPTKGGGNATSISLPSWEGLREGDLVQLINNSNADFLFVAFGPIRQEKWIYGNLQNLGVKLAMGVGGTFDYIAGKRPLPPQFLSSRGLEWLWRLLTQPWRIWRVTKGVLGLIWYTIKAKMK